MPKKGRALSRLAVIDPRVEPVLLAAVGRIHAAAQAVATQAIDVLAAASLSATGNAQRQAYMSAQFDLRANMAAFSQSFGRVLHEKVMADLHKEEEQTTRSGQTDWHTLSLVDETEVEAQVSSGRLAVLLGQECEWELRELGGYFAALLGAARADPEDNPLRPKNVGKALFVAVEAASPDMEARKILSRELAAGLGRAMRASYQAVIEDLRQRGVSPLSLAARMPPPVAGRSVSGVASLSPGDPMPADRAVERALDQPGWRAGGRGAAEGPRATPGATSMAASSATRAGELQYARSLSAMFGMGLPSGFSHTGNSVSGALDVALPSPQRGDTGRTIPGALRSLQPDRLGAAAGPGAAGMDDAAMIDVIKRLAVLGAQSAAGQDAGSSGFGTWSDTTPMRSGSLAAEANAATVPGALSALMAVNLIRAHRDELVRASSTPLDHMVIDVVAALFDQVLSDPKVPPQMARQIARLQLPVLRVAMKDRTFFSSRKHPVRRLVNRIASLAASFDDFNDGPGQECISRVRVLVQEIAEGDFDQMALYEAKLSELERFIREQTAQSADEHADLSALLINKEADLRIQQRYMRALQAQLGVLGLPEFLRDFLAQVWSQVHVLAISREGSEAPLVQRLKRVGRDLALSVQPKGAMQLRKEFLLGLPQLMKDLNEGLALISWPEEAKKEFFAKLLPAHAESLKTAPLTDFARRQLNFQLDQVDKVVPPSRDEVAGEALPGLTHDAPTAVLQLTPEEASHAGLIDESQVDWSASVDIDLGEAGPSTADVDINLDSPPQPSAGSQLINHIQAGVAYQMHINDQWRKVRLSWISPGRTFFIFNHGAKHKQTVSMTGRMLLKMCESGRFRAFEQAELIERATARARRQLAALSTPTAAAKV